MPESEDRMMKWFEFAHLPEPPKEIVFLFFELAQSICDMCAPGPERTVALRKLLEAKDAAVRSKLHPGG